MPIDIFFQHLLEDLVEEVYYRRRCEYRYKEDAKGKLVTWTVRKKESNIGSAVMTFRRRQEEKSKFPLDFWKKK